MSKDVAETLLHREDEVMRVFVFGTGRCGTVCFAAACRHATNYTVLNETWTSTYQWAEQSIEVNPQLRPVIPFILREYPDARFVWLKRDYERVVESFERLGQGVWLTTWWAICNTVRPENQRTAAAIAVDQMLRDCEYAFSLVPEAQRMMLELERIKEPNQFPAFWQWIGAEGDLQAALTTFDIPLNTSAERGDT